VAAGVLSWGADQWGCDVDHSPLSDSKVKNEWNHICIFPVCHHFMFGDNFALYFLCILFTGSAFYSFPTHMMPVQIGYITSEDAVVAYHLMKAPLILCDFYVKEDVKGN